MFTCSFVVLYFKSLFDLELKSLVASSQQLNPKMLTPAGVVQKLFDNFEVLVVDGSE